jgi:hypothetical protein
MINPLILNINLSYNMKFNTPSEIPTRVCYLSFCIPIKKALWFSALYTQEVVPNVGWISFFSCENGFQVWKPNHWFSLGENWLNENLKMYEKKSNFQLLLSLGFNVDRLVNKHLITQRRLDIHTLFFYLWNIKNIHRLQPNVSNVAKFAKFDKIQNVWWWVN